MNNENGNVIDDEDEKKQREATDTLTFEQLHEILLRIRERHSFGHYKHKPWIKYVRPKFELAIDMRDARVFDIVFEVDGEKKEFTHHCTNMFDDITAWLDAEEAKK